MKFWERRHKKSLLEFFSSHLVRISHYGYSENSGYKAESLGLSFRDIKSDLFYSPAPSLA